MNLSLLLSVFTFGFAVWLGFYLIARDPHKARLRYTGYGLVVYALSLAIESASGYAETVDIVLNLARWRWPLLFLPALCWFAASVDLLPEESSVRTRLTRVIDYGLQIAVILLYGISFGLGANPGNQPIHWVLALVVAGLLLIGLRFARIGYQHVRAKRPAAILLTVALFFTLSMGLFLIPIDIIPRDWVLLAVELDLFMLGLSIAVLDAFDEGEALLLDALRSFAVSVLAALIFGGLVGLALVSGEDFTLITLLYATIFAAITIQVFADSLQALIDTLVFSRLPRLRQQRADLRAAANASSRLNEALILSDLDDAEFVRLTRRALSHFGDFNHLAASPLTRLSIIEERLAERGAPDNTLERAAELKVLLAESIARLKPRGQGDFGTSDEWRYYNVLYFPYVVGLKPYSRDGYLDDLEQGAADVLAWFQTTVPERTLHNWQNAAARLIAQDLREQL